ncbi:MAG: hypothetical protein AAGB19_19535 [Cyanobacteria bacterium P01_F01_bin.3]
MVDNAILWFERNRAQLEASLEQAPMVVGVVTYPSPSPLAVMDRWIALYQAGKLSGFLAEAYILRPCRQLREGLKSSLESA